MPIKAPLLFIVLLTIGYGCINQDSHTYNINHLIKNYQHSPGDSIKIMFAKFINDNNNIVNDTTLTNAFIDENINLTLNDWQNYSWTKVASRDLILNYLLPYQIYNEAPGDWRTYFLKKYQSVKDSFRKTNVIDTRKIYDRIINKDLNLWMHYSDYMSGYACNFKDLMNTKKADCVGMAYMYAYALRSMGIPSSVDFVPIWGCSFNAGHAEVVFMDSTDKMRTYEPNRLSRSAKVFRYTFKKQNIWTDSIQPIMDDNEFLLSNLNNDNWLDVTQEHNKVCNISYQLPLNTQASFAYICVYNYGNWQPVFYGAVSNTKVAKFSKMSCKIFYQVAIPKKGGYDLIGRPFITTDSGKIVYLNPDCSHKISMKLQQINGGYLSYIKYNEPYKLYMLDKKNNWHFVTGCTGLRDSTIFAKNIPANAMYKLVNVNNSKRLERPFTYENNKQVWW